MKLLTFLGTGRYDETTYVLDTREQSAFYAPVASCAFLRPDELIVFATKDAQDAHGETIRAAVSVPIVFKAIPLGANERELWDIFEQIGSAVQPRDEVAFDITHGLRSFPLIGLLAATFLRAGLDVKVRAVLYGAFDVGKVVSPGRTPMFDLYPMLGLLEWAVAADRFNRTGDARYLANLVESHRKESALAAKGDPEQLRQIGALGNLASTLSKISQGLQLIRPRQVMEQVAGLPERIERARPAMERAASAQPFSLLLERVAQTYQPLAQSALVDDAPRTRVRQTLVTERGLIHWYAEREHWAQAVSLAREWFVSWVMFQLGVFNTTQLDARDRISNVIGAEASDFVKAKQSGKPFASIFLAAVPCMETVLALWHPLTQARNDVLHAGMREEPGKPDDLIEQIRQHIATLDTLPLDEPGQIQNPQSEI